MPALFRRHPLLLPLATTAIVVLFVVLRYQNAAAFDRFARLQLLPILGILLAIGIRWFAPTLKFRLIVQQWENPIGLRQCFSMQLIGACGSAITPAASGSTPTYLWYMWRLGVPGAQAGAVMAYVVALDAVLFSVSVPLLLPWFLGQVGAEAPYGIVLATLLLSIVSFAFAVILLWRPAWIQWLCGKILRPFPKLWSRLSATLDDTADAITAVRRLSVGFHCLCMLLNVIEWAAVFAVLPLAALALGYPVAFLELIWLQDIMQVVAFFFPTPGGSGWFEVVLPEVAGAAWPTEEGQRAPVILLWRFFSYWIYLILTILFGTSMIVQALERRGPRGRRPEDRDASEKKEVHPATQSTGEETSHADG